MMPVQNHRSEEDASLVALVGCVVKRPFFEGLVVCQVLCRLVLGAGFRAAGRWQEVTAKSQASGITSFPLWCRRVSSTPLWAEIDKHLRKVTTCLSVSNNTPKNNRA